MSARCSSFLLAISDLSEKSNPPGPSTCQATGRLQPKLIEAEVEGEFAHALFPPMALRVVNGPIPAEEKKVLSMFELMSLGGERLEKSTRQDHVSEEDCPASEQSCSRRNLADENLVPLPRFFTSVGSSSAASMIAGYRAAPKSFLCSISFSKSRRMSCRFARARSPITDDEFSSPAINF